MLEAEDGTVQAPAMTPPPTTPAVTRYFVGHDNSGHEYLVPVSDAAAWRVWSELPDDDERGWDVPAYAQRLDGGTLTFEAPRVEKL